jgi:hypothetical protein
LEGRDILERIGSGCLELQLAEYWFTNDIATLRDLSE